MIKLIIQIPCFNEEESLGVTLSDLPQSLPGVDVVEWMVIDDGSTDRTIDVARRYGVDHIIRLPRHCGLARSFTAGIEAGLERGADIIVNTDADNQYCAADIQRLIEPILDGDAEVVIGARPIDEIRHFSPLKKLLQRWGSWVVRCASCTDVPDAASGFRAFSRSAAMQIQVFQEYSYTMETIIGCGQRGMAVRWLPVRVNPPLRPSRLVRSVPSYLANSALTIIRSFMTYRPFKFFALPGMALVACAMFLGLRYAYFYFSGDRNGHVQSLVVGAAALMTGCCLIITALLADMVAANRQLLEKIHYRMQRMEDATGANETDQRMSLSRSRPGFPPFDP